jgi:hypothetical protein
MPVQSNGATNHPEEPICLRLPYHCNKRSCDDGTSETSKAKLPSLLEFPCSSEHSHHYEYDIKGRGDVENLQCSVPVGNPWRCPE